MNHAERVPWTAGWTGEERFFVGQCRYAGGHWAICQPHAPGTGKPTFAKPHSNRQRKAMAELRCDLCGEQLKGGPKVSLSFERLADVGLIQVEPLLHPKCAAISMRYCPHLNRHAAAGTIFIREVHACRLAVARLTAAAVKEFTGENWRDGEAFGHAKLLIDRFDVRDLGWLQTVGGAQ